MDVNSENSFTTKAGKNIPPGFSMSTISSFESIENKHDLCRGKDGMKKIHTINIINFKKKTML